jgi:hypothetical protein
MWCGRNDAASGVLTWHQGRQRKRIIFHQSTCRNLKVFIVHLMVIDYYLWVRG